jgi:hypothetical protein
MDINQFFRWEQATRDTIDVKKIYVDMADDLIAGVLLSQIVYWFLPDKEGKTKLRVHKDGELWLVKGREDWWDECRIKPRQFDTAFNKLMEKGLVEKKTFKFDGNPMTHIRIVWDNFLTALNIELDKLETLDNTGFNKSVKTEKHPETLDNTGFNKSVKTKSQICNSVLSKSVKTITENTTKITKEDDEYISKRGKFSRAFEEKAKKIGLPEDVIKETADLIDEQNIVFTDNALRNALKEGEERYINDSIKHFPSWFIKTVKDKQNKQFLKAEKEIRKSIEVPINRFAQFNWLEQH